MSSSPNHYTKRRSPPSPPPSISATQPRSKSTGTTGVGGGGFFGKSVLFGLFLLALPLFPSQAPDFVGETVLTKFWELIHLLFVGIAVAYGLFSRRNVESSSGGGVDLRMSRVDESSLSYVSRIFHVSSLFDEDEFESHSISGQASVVVKERKPDESFVEESSEIRAWNSQYFQGRSKVVVAKPAYGLVDGHVVHQPLGLPVRSLRSSLRDSFSENEKTESLVDDEEVIAPAVEFDSSSSPVVQWPEMMGIGENYPETQFESHKSRSSSSSSSSSSSQTSVLSNTQNRYSPSCSVSEEESNVEESVKETSLQDSSSRSSSPSLPPSPSLSLSPSPPLPPSPKLVIYDDTNRRVVSHSRHYSDGSILKEDVRGRRTEFSSKKEPGSKSLKLTGESSRRRSKSRRSYPPDSTSSPPIDDSTRDLEQKSDEQDISTEKGLEFEVNSPRARKQWSRDSLELTAEDTAKDDEKFTESFPSTDVLFQPKNAIASRRGMRSSRGGGGGGAGSEAALPEKEVVTRNSEDYGFDKSRKKELKSNSLRTEPSQSWRGSTNVQSRGKSVRTIRGKEVTMNGESSDDRGGEAKVEETRGRTKPRRQWKEELAIVPHVRAKSEPEDDEVVMEETELEEQPQVNLEEEAAWESQSNASHDHNEVDRKAGEFIAKFREQIRLQKLTSGEQPRGGGGRGSGIMRDRHFR